MIGLLVPKVWVSVATALGVTVPFVARVEFSNTITVGSIFVAAIVVVLGGIFTLRNNLRSFWKDLAEERAEKIESLEAEVKERDERFRALAETGRQDIAHLLEEQRTIRHELKNELAAANASLALERAKTDLSALMELLATQHGEAMATLGESLAKQTEIIELLSNGNGVGRGSS